MISVFGIGNPLMDYIAYDDFSFLESLEATPGTMNLVTREQRERILSRIKDYRTIPGGSCANTIRGIAWLGRGASIDPPLFAGAVGADDVGDRYIALLRDMDIEVRISRKSCETGVSVIIVTPDYERTMFTYLGSCREYGRDDLDADLLKHARYFHTTGYMWDTESQKEATRLAMDEARAGGVPVSFDLADPFVVQRYREDFLRWVPDRVDILFGNREEMALMLGSRPSDEELAAAAGAFAPLAVMKVGSKGCYINSKGQVSHVDGVTVDAVDTVGAGDFFAAGFLYGCLRSMETGEAARLANRLAAAIVAVEGCNLEQVDRRWVLGDRPV